MTDTTEPGARQTQRSFAKSIEAYEDARAVLPGGVSSPVRAFRAVGGQPVFVARGEGSRFWDIDGNDYVDYVLSWGPLILGHAHPAVVARTTEALRRGTSFGAPTLAETELAHLIVELMPAVEMVRLVSSGTEATMSALRLARTATNRPKIVKFSGCYHGHADMLLVQAGSGVATLGLPDSPGVPAGATVDTLVADFNDLASVQALFDELGELIAAVIVEPVAGNMGFVPPAPGFLEGLRDITSRNGALLIFDEVMTGFRVALGGATEVFGVQPDLVTLGKVVGGGFPLAAYAGRRDIMEHVAPAGTMYQAGTLSGNPVATAAGISTLSELRQPGVFDAIAATTERLMTGLVQAAADAGVPLQTAHLGAMAGIAFNDAPVTNYAEAAASRADHYATFFQELLQRGVYIAPSQFEAIFVSSAHSPEDVELTLAAAGEAFRRVVSSG